MRQLLIRFAKKIEGAWQHVNLDQGAPNIMSGWYVLEVALEGAMRSTPRILVKKQDGKTATRELIGAHSGRNRMLVYLPQGQLSAYSESLEFERFALVPAWEGRARVLLICWRYLLDFFSPWTFIRMIAMQFKNPFDLSTDVLQFYSPPEKTILEALEWWQRRPKTTKLTAKFLRSIKIGVVIEQEFQRERLINMVCPPDQIITADEPWSEDCDFWIPLASTEELRGAAILLLKITVWRAQRKGTQTQLIYTDHDYAANGTKPQRPEPVFKPSPSRVYLHCFDYIGPAVMFSTTLARTVEPAHVLEDAQRYQLCLAALEHPEQVKHLPELLFSSRRTKPLTTPEPLSQESPWPGIRWQRRQQINILTADLELQNEPSVDLVVPTRDGLNFLVPCVEGLLDKTSYRNLQVIIVDNGSELPETLSWLEQIAMRPRVSVVRYPGEFNFSAINNAAAASGSGEYIGLINNDIEVIHPDWLTQMMAWAQQPSVGIVGAKLLFSNGLVQHAGVTIGMGNAAGHIHRLEDGDAPGYQNRCIATQNMMAVTAACFITPRRLYEELGGLNEKDFKVAYNDIDYCLRVEKQGLDVIWTPEARLYHHESVTRGDDMSEQHIKRYFKELKALQRKWRTKGFVDKYYNKHLRIGDEGVYPQIDVAGEDSLRELRVI